MTDNQDLQLERHKAVGPCMTRPPYRDGRLKKAVKCFTIADESAYLIILGVPTLKLEHQLAARILKTCQLKHLRRLENYPAADAFTETFLVHVESINGARKIKRQLDDKSFFGAPIRVVYAPEFETIDETRIKFHNFRQHARHVFAKYS
ncbi:hypothetical protein Ciccas_013020 [Cichlidogyrus casuarinus]|uniref:Uncharacterized protein n=1 Tax=Cichlidogyrus casuarinus TaxID=1844966 RepID=A0ABD2PLP6_9PLAT